MDRYDDYYRSTPEVFGSAPNQILVFGLIRDLKRQDVVALVALIEKLLAPNGLLFITAFGNWDPAFENHQREWAEDSENSFCSLDGVVRTYLEPGELVAMFPGLEVIRCWKGLGPEHRHGDGPPERHGLAEAVLRSP
jgi:hypothetical protein